MSALLDLDRVRIDPAPALAIPSTFALKRRLLPFAEINGVVHVACLVDIDRSGLETLRRRLGRPCRAEPAEPRSLQRALERVYGDRGGDARRVAVEDGQAAHATCDALLRAAVLRGASDIHIDPSQDDTRVRFRVDGRLEDYTRLNHGVTGTLVSRLKVLSGMDIAEKRAPQDGRFQQDLRDGRLELRVATLPTVLGERMTLRLLALQSRELTLGKLGLGDADLDRFDDALKTSHGMILVTGPTGSGKSTTLYAAIRRLLEGTPRNIITVEDPVELRIEGVAQVEVDSREKMSFGRALRSILRHDPDVIMIGEIRDSETAELAVQAALTGHLMFSTLHTNSAVGAVTRLHDMGVDRYLTAATLRLVVAQRLVRRLCTHCRERCELDAVTARLLGRPTLEGAPSFRAVGCCYCAGRGFSGRLGLFELLPFDREWLARISAGADESELARERDQRGLATLLDDAIGKLASGATACTELLSTVHSG